MPALGGGRCLVACSGEKDRGSELCLGTHDMTKRVAVVWAEAGSIRERKRGDDAILADSRALAVHRPLSGPPEGVSEERGQTYAKVQKEVIGCGFEDNTM